MTSPQRSEKNARNPSRAAGDIRKLWKGIRKSAVKSLFCLPPHSSKEENIVPQRVQDFSLPLGFGLDILCMTDI